MNWGKKLLCVGLVLGFSISHVENTSAKTLTNLTLLNSNDSYENLSFNAEKLFEMKPLVQNTMEIEKNESYIKKIEKTVEEMPPILKIICVIIEEIFLSIFE